MKEQIVNYRIQYTHTRTHPDRISSSFDAIFTIFRLPIQLLFFCCNAFVWLVLFSLFFRINKLDAYKWKRIVYRYRGFPRINVLSIFKFTTSYVQFSFFFNKNKWCEFSINSSNIKKNVRLINKWCEWNMISMMIVWCWCKKHLC